MIFIRKPNPNRTNNDNPKLQVFFKYSNGASKSYL